MIAAVLLSVFGLAASASFSGVCPRGEWSEWSACKSSKTCISPADMKIRTQTYSMQPTTYDKGREVMKKMMAEKKRIHEQRIACQKSGACGAEFKMPPTEGFAACVSGSANGYPCRNVDMLSFVSLADLGYSNPLPGDSPAGNDIWAWHDTVTGDHYAIACTSGGTSFVRVTDPRNPTVLGFLYSATGPAVWRDAKVIGDVAYIVADEADHGLQVVDLTQFRGKNTFSYINANYHYTEFGNSHNIAANIETKTLFAVGCTQTGYNSCRGGLHMLDVTEPLRPVFAGCYSDDGYTHDTQCVIYHGPDAAYQGREICFGFNEDTLTIVDVTVHSAPVLVSKTGYDAHYTHQGWLTEDHTIVLLDDELDERNAGVGNGFTATYIWDVRSLRAPILRNTYLSSETSIDHNQYIMTHNGFQYTFQSNYEAGLRILHIDQTNFDLQEVAFFDVFPPSTTPVFRGTWSNYPWYPGGFVAVESIDYGMFLLQPNYAAMQLEVAAKQRYASQSRTCGDKTETLKCIPTEQC